MDIKLIIVLLIIILLTSLGLYFIVQNTIAPNENQNQELIQNTEKVIVDSKKFELNNDEFDVSYNMPVVKNLKVDFLNYINTKIQKEIDYKNVYNERIEGIENKSKIGKFTYKSDFVRYDCSKYTSIICSQKIQLGVERLITRKKCYVIDSEEEKTAILANVFKDKVNYKKYILDEINKQARQKGIEILGGKDLSELSETQSFYIKDNKLVLYFETGKISPVVNGELEFEMPFVLNQEGLFEKNA